VDRLACVDVPALPLQLLLLRHPEWREHPAAVVERDNPQARLLWVNERARQLGILPGLRYAAALGLTGELRAGVVERDEIKRGVAELTRILGNFTPEVEPSEDEPGVCWLDATGLDRLYRSADAWAREIHQALHREGFTAAVVVGFTRFGTYAVARSSRGARAFRDPGAEQAAARRVPLDRLGVEPSVREALARLGVFSAGAFLELPASGVFERFGDEAERLHRLATGRGDPPLSPVTVDEPVRGRLELESPDGDLQRLLFLVKQLVDPLLARLVERHELLEQLVLVFRLDRGGQRTEAIRPAKPTLEAPQLYELVRLRLEGHPLDDAVEEMTAEVHGVRARGDQLRLFADGSRRNLAAAGRALARLRAEFGPAAVVRARLREGHLPEAGFLWEPLEGIDAPEARRVAERTLVRRLYQRPAALPPRPNTLRDDSWIARGTDYGPVEEFTGPYVVSGGWWVKPVHRDYHFAHTRRGDLLWVYFDRRRRRWFLQGRVE
jgi:protein ImuB